MKRLSIDKRNLWQAKLEDIGFTFHSLDGVYWNEGICYEFTAEEIDWIEAVTGEMDRLCLEAVAYVIEKNLWENVGVPWRFRDFIKVSWEQSDRSLYGRFDFFFDGEELKLLEYNADTPTSLIESSVAQWMWLEDVFPRCDQFNSIHEKLTAAFGDIGRSMPERTPFYFTCVHDHEEDFVNVEYLRDVALQAGLDARHLFIEDIGCSRETGRFYDMEGGEIRFLFKLYPWEWMLNDEFADQILGGGMTIFEPPWKMVLSSKGILPVLWEMYPGHENLLATYFEESRFKGSYVRKPLFSREGANIFYRRRFGRSIRTDGSYGGEGCVYQELKELPCFEGNYAAIGSWIINGEAAGIGIREDDTPITRNTSRFVPHYFKP
jgi:glutathionylspermidine synthase